MPAIALQPGSGISMLSRQETARPPSTPGEIMQLPADQEIVLVSGCPPIRTAKARYLRSRLLERGAAAAARDDDGRRRRDGGDDWSGQVAASPPAGIALSHKSRRGTCGRSGNTGIRKEPELPDTKTSRQAKSLSTEFDFVDDGLDDDDQRVDVVKTTATNVARQAVIYPLDHSGPRRNKPMRSKHTFRLPPGLAGQLADLRRARKRIPQALVAETALSIFLSPDSSQRRQAARRRLHQLTRRFQWF